MKTREAAISSLDFSAYPFNLADLLKGLRAYLDDAGLNIHRLQTLPLPSFMPGFYGDVAVGYSQRPFAVEVNLQGTLNALALTLHQTAPEHIRRDLGFYTELAEHVLWIPIITPGFVAADPKAGWLILEGLSDLREPDRWKYEDYREATLNLAKLHDRYWNLENDLKYYTWLWQPLRDDYGQIKETVAAAVEHLTDIQPHDPLNTPRYQALLKIIEAHLDKVVSALHSQPFTLTHGSYWAGNIARQLDGRQIVTHWQYVAIAPAILDVVMFYQSTLSHIAPLPAIHASVDRYRELISEMQGKVLWKDREWNQLWDYSLIWLFALHWLERLATMPVHRYEHIHQRMAAVWLEPVAAALEAQLRVRLPK